MTCETVQKRAMATWYVVDTTHENEHPVGVGKSISVKFEWKNIRYNHAMIFFIMMSKHIQWDWVWL